MKKNLLSVLAASALLFAATSCSETEELTTGGNGKGEKVSFQVVMDGNGPASRANLNVGEGTMADILYYEVIDKNTGEKVYDDKASIIEGLGEDKSQRGVNLTLDLVKGVSYDILFWAHNEEGSIFNAEDLTKVTMNTTELMANMECYDAFTAALNGYKVQSVSSTLVSLKRPFAQVNVGTTEEDWTKAVNLKVEIDQTKMIVKGVNTVYNVAEATASTPVDLTYDLNALLDQDNKLKIQKEGEAPQYYHYLGLNYMLADAESSMKEMTFVLYDDEQEINTIQVSNLPIRRNYRTNVIGNLLTSDEGFEVVIDGSFVEDDKYGVLDGKTYIKVKDVNEFYEAISNADYDMIILENDIVLDESASRSAVDPTLTISSGKALTIDLNGKKLSATSTQTGKNYDMILVKGTLTVKNGNIETQHQGSNMEWNNMTTIFDVTAGGVLNLENVTAKNLGGSDMGFVAHLNNWGEVTLNVENCTLESNYVAVRVFNNGNDMNNVTIKNSTLKGGSYAFWVHNYTAADFGSEEKAETHEALLNFDIFNGTNTFVGKDNTPIRFGMTNKITSNGSGITKVVSEDGSVVTLGSVVEDGVVSRGFAGAEENTTIKKVVVGEGVTTLYDRTFRRFYALETVELPSTLTTIGAAGTGVFQSCSALKDIVIPESVTVLGNGTFYGCISLTSINIPTGVTRIEENALRETGLTSVEFHAGVTYFGAQAFRDCDALTEIVINAPSFTVENNTFNNVAYPCPATKIYVRNGEMKQYLEGIFSGNSSASHITVIAPNEATDNESLKTALEGEGKIVNVAAGEYTFPASSVKAGAIINCAEGTIFKGQSSLDIKGATVVGATFKNDEGIAVRGTINGTFKDCTFDGSEAIRWCYTTAGKSVVFENCNIKTNFRGIHFDGMNGDVTFKNCNINGFNAYSGEGTMTFEGCTFGNDASGYNGLNIYSNTILKNCKFTYVSGKTNFIDMEGTGKVLTINSCTATLDGAAVNISGFVGGSKLADNTVTIDGKTLVK